MTMEDKAVMDIVVERVRAIMPVSMVILFGSRARGDTHEDSDFDICVVVDEIQGNIIKEIQRIRHSLYGHVHYPIDVLLYDKANFSYRSKNRSFEKTIFDEGVRIYG